MTQWLRQSTATTIKMGPFSDSTDGDTEKTALSIAQADIRLTKNGAGFAQTHNAAGATHDEHGYYGVPLDTTDTDTLGRLRVAIHKSTALPVWMDFVVVSPNIYDSFIGGGDVLDVSMVQILGAAITGTAAQIVAAFTHLLDVAVPALTVASVDQTGDSFARIGAAGAGLTGVAGIVWNALTASYVTAGSFGLALGSGISAIAALVWSYTGGRTLTQSAASIAAIVAGSAITLQRGDTSVIALTGLGAITGYKKLWFTIKRAVTDADTASIVMVLLSSPGAGTDGLQYLNGLAATANQGSVAVNDATAGNITITLAAAATANLSPVSAANPLVYDVQWRDASDLIHTLTTSTATVTGDVTRTAS